MKFRPISISAKSRYITGVTTFSGLDLSTQRFKVSQGRAIDMNNFIYKDGVIQKREGIEEIFSVEPTYYIVKSFDNEKITNIPEDNYRLNTTNFNGIWSFTAEDGKLHIIAHIGKLLYEVTDITNDNISISPITETITSIYHNGNYYIEAYEFEDYKSDAFVGSKRLYFLGGNKFMCLKYKSDENGNSIRYFYPIEDDVETYIPTTTTSITYKNSAVGGRSSLDKVNLLTKWRKNELISGTLKSEDDKTKTDFFDYSLDSPLIWKDEKDMKDFSLIIEEGGTIE